MEEKELIDLIAGYQANGEDCIDARDIDDLAKAIIAKYPQIEKKPVRLHPTQFNVAHSHRYGFEQLDRFRSDEERQAWIERHYCEVFE